MDGVNGDPAEPVSARVPVAGTATHTIYCGDNLDKLKTLPDECVDLIYIDPPFNSNRNYEVFWEETAEKRRFDDRHESTRAYIDYMRPRCVELARVLKKTGSFYYHCDWHASHYVKVMLDQIFGENYFQNEVIWKRTTSHNDSKKYANIHDTIFYYTASDQYTWNPQYVPHGEKYVRSHYNRIDGHGRKYRLDNIIRSASMGPRPNLAYEYKEFTPKWGWRVERAKLEAIDADGRLVWVSSGTPYLVRYLDEMSGAAMPSIWDDIPPVNSQATERLGYPTQKPLPLLERVIKASSNPGDIVLDAFCGCGTAMISAENLGRRWIGIDISPTACRVMAERLKTVCKLKEGRDFYVRDLPKTPEQLRKYPPFEFENWAVNALNTVLVNGHAIANRAKVGDMGIDGRIYPIGVSKEKKNGRDLFGDTDFWLPIQVKQKDKAGRPDIDLFETAMRRQGRNKGFFISFDFTSDAKKEIDRVMRETNGMEIIPITVDEILAEELRFRV